MASLLAFIPAMGPAHKIKQTEQTPTAEGPLPWTYLIAGKPGFFGLEPALWLRGEFFFKIQCSQKKIAPQKIAPHFTCTNTHVQSFFKCFSNIILILYICFTSLRKKKQFFKFF
jgi:hypothetical protein